MSRFLSLIAIVVALVPVAQQRPAHATFPGDNGKIVFVRVPDERAVDGRLYGLFQQVFSMNPDGTELEQLTSFGSAQIGSPNWSPDGGKIVFARWKTNMTSSAGELMLMDADGSHLLNLTRTQFADERYPRWSPDGRRLAFIRTVRDLEQIFVMRLTAPKEARRITRFQVDVHSLAWSPTGRRIAFVMGGRRPGGQDRRGGADIYSIRPDGTGLKRVTKGALVLDEAGGAGLSWSPDGKRIAFADYRHAGCFDMPSATCNAEIYIVDADGSDAERVTDNMSWDFDPVWSPDGTKIVFASDRTSARWELFVMNADGTDPQRLTQPLNDDFAPNWQSLP